MTYSVKHARSGRTAIAAVLALSSTPLAAQEAADPLAPAAETTATPVPETTASEPMVTASEPVADTTAAETTAAETTAAETAAPATTARPAATRSRTKTTATRRATSEAAAAAAPADAAPATQAPAEGMPVPPPTGAIVDRGPMPVDETVMETTAAPADDALPIAGAAGLALLALGGIGMAVGRRRQRREELAHQRANREYLATHPDTSESHAPAFPRAAAAPALAAGAPGAVLKDAPRTKLPPNFDLSRFGPHVRAAYQGPTEDNPSLSMKHRLRRAAAMDQQLRQHGEVPHETVHGDASASDTVQVAAPTKQPTKPMWSSDNDGFMLRRAGSKPPSKPAYQH